jgi:hypothetical protein
MLHRTRHLFIRQQTAVINAIRTRLLVTGLDRAKRPTVEVAHEALIRTWPRPTRLDRRKPGEASCTGGAG